MAGFRKAAGQQAALKMGLYGPPGSGKTFTTLLFCEGISVLTGKRFAYVDTERGTDFYTQRVQEREAHPEPFDFDALYTRSLTEVLRECQKLSPDEYCAVAIDSITHLWEAAIAAYGGKKTSAGTIPMHAWGSIKKPYKDLMQFLLNSPLHVFILGRQKNEWADDDTGETKNVGYAMRAEGETAYEPHILIRLESCKPAPQRGKRPDTRALATPTAFVEKDRTGVLHGHLIEWPSYDSVVVPLLRLLGGTQAQVQSQEEAASEDADALARAERDKHARSSELRRQFEGELLLCKTEAAVKTVAGKITAKLKKEMTDKDVEAVRTAWAAALGRVQGNQQGEQAGPASGGESPGDAAE